MDIIINSLTEWLKEILVSGIVHNLTGLFDDVNQKVRDIAGQVGTTPSAWNGSIYTMIRRLSDTVILPIAGLILAFVMTLELIQIISDRNNMNDIGFITIFRWVFKTSCAVLIVSNTWNIIMGVFDAAQSIVSSSSGVIVGDTDIRIDSIMTNLEARLSEMNVGQLLGLWFQSLFVGISMWVLSVCIFIIVYGRMLEIYVVTSAAPIPMATITSRDGGHMGQNYLRSLAALGLQAFLIMVCVAIYAALVQHIPTADSISYAIWTSMGYTVLLAFSLFRTGNLARMIMGA